MTSSAIAARTLTACAIMTSAGLAHAGGVQMLYDNSFDAATDIGSEWSVTTHSDGPLGGFLGRFSSQPAYLTLGVPPTPDPDPDPDPIIDPPVLPIDELPQIGPTGPARSTGDVWVYSLVFDLNLIDSWDGQDASFGNDFFRTKINGTMVFDEFLTNHRGGEDNFRIADEGPYDMGWGEFKDSVYRDIRVDFLLSDAVSELEFKFRGTTSQSIEDESWGLDNVRVFRQLVTVPAPASGLALGIAGLALTRRRR